MEEKVNDPLYVNKISDKHQLVVCRVEMTAL